MINENKSLELKLRQEDENQIISINKNLIKEYMLETQIIDKGMGIIDDKKEFLFVPYMEL